MSPSLSPIFFHIRFILFCLKTLLAEVYLVYYKHYHTIAVSCTRTGIKRDQKKEEKIPTSLADTILRERELKLESFNTQGQ